MSKPPTDLELMMLHDGELDPARAEEVMTFLEGDRVARDKRWSLEVVGAGLREVSSRSDEKSPDMVDDILAYVDASSLPSSKKQGGVTVLSDRREEKKHSSHATSKAANDNGRLIFGLAAVAAAAAALMFFWGRAGNDRTFELPTATDAPQAKVEPPPSLSPSLDVSSALAPERLEKSELGVEVAAVDFGTKSGTIYYVPSDDKFAASATTVVWLAEE